MARSFLPHNVVVRLSGHESGAFAVEYAGSHDQLIAAGVATASMLAGDKPGKERRDQNGDRYSVVYGDGWLRLTQWKSIDQLKQMPGVTSQLIQQARIEWQHAVMRLVRYEHQLAGETVGTVVNSARPSLRLVRSNPAI